ncbi:SGNH/GDSL hydrolase family protein [Planctomicrobium piriforme]|uniref:GDSL-like Lipase/Acylhydrolase family protein n=1 Tax=Planctomicrobium piriforme TaxID=1576369 RepID=A0A1I3HCX6_9PLAN|nr:SGNH/GDSL hydrolase family protein [Planctomicrobium piriforme]SFI33410.1 GDSL-like Lipase/Acylhydrolase family protein [Planctomicrobium piriforme]
MISTLARSVLCFFAAVVLLALVLCAVEVGCRGWQLFANLRPGAVPFSESDLTIPSATSWTEVRPLVDVQHLTPSGEYRRIRTNEMGLRGASVTIPKPRGTFRILCVGGNSVFGQDLAEEETLPGYLQQYLSKHAGVDVEVINAGCPQSGPLSQLLRYRAQLSALQPDIVLLCLSVDDLAYDVEVRGALRLDAQRQPAYAAHPGSLKSGFNIAEGACREFLCVSWLSDWIGKAMGTGSARQPTVSLDGGYGRRELGSLVSFSQLVSINFSHLIVSTSPSAWGLEQTRAALQHQRPTFADDISRVLVDLHAADQVQVHDALPAFCRLSDPRSAFSSRRGCLTAPGNDLYAQSLARYLLESVPGLLKSETTSMPTVLPKPESMPTALDRMPVSDVPPRGPF